MLNSSDRTDPIPAANPLETNAEAAGYPACFWQAALDSLTAHIAIVDREGRIVAVNASWRRFAGENGQKDPNWCIGVNYLEICDRAFAGENGEEGAVAAENIRAVLAGRRREFYLPYPCHSPIKKRWFMLRVTRFEGPGPGCAVIAHENITAPKAAQIRATQMARKLESANVELRRQASDLERAEALEADSNHILEQIARNEVLDTILLNIAQLVERQLPALHCAVVRFCDQRVEVAAAPTLPPSLVEALATADVFSLSEFDHSPLLQLMRAVETPNNPAGDLRCFRFLRIPMQSAISGGCLAITEGQGHPVPALSPVMTRAASLVAVALDHAALYEKLSFQARHDSLTEVPNRLLFQERLQNVVSLGHRAGRIFAVAMLDLDRFKQVNDLHGHRFGDSLLRQVAHRILDCMRTGDTVARLGGDEFAMILDDLRSPEQAREIASRIIGVFEAPFSIYDQELKVTGSLGYSIFPEDGSDPAALVRNADAALYRSKRYGRNLVHRYDASMGRRALERLEIERHLRGAVDRGEFEVHYQLQLDMDRRISGMEALARWRSPILGMVPPDRFIPVAEDAGLIAEIGNFVLRSACRRSVQWQRCGLPAARMAVNVSMLQLVRPGFVELVASVLAETGLESNLLEIEITESAMMSNMEEVIDILEQLGALGVKLSIDDFGTGYSSLSYLQNLPVDAIKIDRSFIRELDGNSGSGKSVVRAIIDLAHSLKLKVVAEGVETQSQLDALSSLACDVAQGYLLHRPLTADAVAEMLADQNTTELMAPLLC